MMASMPLYQMSLFRMPKSVARRLEKLQRDFLWEGGNLERKVHLVNWEVENLWKQVLLAKYGQEGLGWRTKKVNGAFGIGVWKEILKENDWCWENMEFTVGNGTKIRFWIDLWRGCIVLSQRFPHLYVMAAHRNATVEEMWDQNVGQRGWDLRFMRDFNDPLSPYLFVLGMEVLSAMLRRAVDGGFISGCNIQGRGGMEINVSHLLFADDTIIFCEARQDHITYLSWILVWFEAAFGLRINLAKSEVIPVGEVEDIEMLAVELGCKVGTLPSVYLGLPLGAKHKAMAMWDGVEARMRRRLALWKRQYLSKGGRITLIKSTLANLPVYQLSLFRMPKLVVKRLEKLQRDFLWGGGSMERKIHLINWEVVCSQKESGGLGIRKIDLLNKALLGKWIWRFAFEEDMFWRKVVGVKYGQLGFGWRTKEARGTFGVGVWREILKESSWCWENIKFKVGKGTKVSFWTDHWCGNEVLSQAFPQLFTLAAHRSASVNEMWDSSLGQGGWNIRLSRNSNDWELDALGELLHMLRDLRISLEEDAVIWKGEGHGRFQIRDAYKLLTGSNVTTFPERSIWVDKVPTKVAFFAWEASWEKLLTLDKLQRRGWQLPNRCFLCGCDEENVNHILLHCTVVRPLWEIVLALFGANWVFPEKVKEMLVSWRGPFVGRKRKKIWTSIPLCIFWTGVYGRGVLFAFRFFGMACHSLRGGE
ncbi:putative ribonuclease H protein [Vitis vinifera]|uniref:Putative ribonuclease H protein n=1 Tax=Vitis vinifera TaxID=29760 RepID=A0A438G080_VITVI|nr:putative ribonuclease H protein [Vitis vinifera]